jgi:flagellum-specific peptidoglycan hydrolase FlgJ
MKYLIFGLLGWYLYQSTTEVIEPLLELYSAPSEIIEVVANRIEENPPHVRDYILAYADKAIEEQKVYNIPASLILSQGMLESSFGRSKAVKELNAHFCIKGKNKLSKRYFDKAEKSNDTYKGYKSAWWSFRDHSHLLTGNGEYIGNSTYSWIFKENSLTWVNYNISIDNTNQWRKKKGLKEIPKMWRWSWNRLETYEKVAHSVQVSGYATDIKYANKLIKIIEKYSLNELDI